MFSPAKRLLLLMIVGLGSLYVMHLLAQDFMKLSKPLFMASGKRDISSFNRTAELNVSWLIAVLTCAIIFCFEFYVRISEIAYSNIYYPIYIPNYCNNCISTYFRTLKNILIGMVCSNEIHWNARYHLSANWPPALSWKTKLQMQSTNLFSTCIF